jgi:hypothetical protein
MEQIELVQPKISIVYYPTCKDLLYGHLKLNIGSTSYDIINGRFTQESNIHRALMRSYTGGWPCIQFVMNMDQQQCNALLQRAPDFEDGNCSQGVCRQLARYGDYSIPTSLRRLPLAIACYLAAAYVCGSKRVKNMHVHSNGTVRSKVTMLPGIIGESIPIIAICYGGYLVITLLISSVV